MDKEEEKIEDMKIENKKQANNYNELAENIIEVIDKSDKENQFQEFAEFLGSFLELSIIKFGDETVLNHLGNIDFEYKQIRLLKRLGVIKEEKKK